MVQAAETGPRAALRKGALAVDALYLALAVLLVQQHAYHVNFSESLPQRAQRHARLLTLEGDAPWAYRLLSPALAEALSIPLALLGLSPDEAREYGYLTLRLVLIAATLLLFHRFCRRFVPTEWAITGTVLLATLHAPSFLHYWFQPASPLDLLLWLAAAMMTLRGQLSWLPLLVFLGTLNRETAVFMIAIHAALRLGEEPLGKLAGRCAGLAVVWATAFFGLRAVITVSDHALEKTPLEMVVKNLDPEWAIYAMTFLGAWAVIPLLGWKSLPGVLKRLALVMVPYVGLLMLFGRIREVRLLLPLAIPLIPATMLLLRDWLAEEATDQPGGGRPSRG